MRYKIVRPTTLVAKIKEVIDKEGQSLFPVVSTDRIFLGDILAEDLQDVPESKTAGDVLSSVMGTLGKRRQIYVHDGDSLEVALAVMDAFNLQFVPVVGRDLEYIGTVDRAAALS